MTATTASNGARYDALVIGSAAAGLTCANRMAQAGHCAPLFRFANGRGDRRAVDPVLEQFRRPGLGKFAGRLAVAFGLPGANLLKYQSRTRKQLRDEHLKSPRLKGYFSMLSAG